MIREVLRMEKVTYKEQGRILLDNFNITVRKGEVFGLIPVNRYGMDAFLKLLQQNMPLHYGYVYYREQLVNQWQRSHNRTNRISIIRNKSSLAEDLTVVDNIFVLRRGFHKYLIHPGMLERLLYKMFPGKMIEKYLTWTELKGRFLKLFTLAIFLPVAPDDFLCYLAGTTNMTWKQFVTVIFLGKPFSIALYSLGLTTLFQVIFHLL